MTRFKGITPDVLRRAVVQVRRGGGMCMAVERVMNTPWAHISSTLAELYTASGEGPWATNDWGFLLQFGGKRGLAEARDKRAACLLRMADWLEREGEKAS